MAVAGIVLESQVSGGKVMSVDPDGSSTEGTSLIPLRHEIEGSISIDKDRLVTGNCFPDSEAGTSGREANASPMVAKEVPGIVFPDIFTYK